MKSPIPLRDCARSPGQHAQCLLAVRPADLSEHWIVGRQRVYLREQIFASIRYCHDFAFGASTVSAGRLGNSRTPCSAPEQR